MRRKTNEEVITILINKMLEPYKVDMEYVKANPEIEGQPWFIYYTCTQEQADEFKKLVIDTFRKEFRWTKAMAEKQYQWFKLMWGLKVIE